MKLVGSVEVVNRDLPSLNMSGRRPERSNLIIGIMPGKNKEPYILHQTLRNFAGVKYKIRGNVETVFSKFVSSGKATIRFKNPPNDLLIRSSVHELSTFMKILRHLLEEKPLDQLKASCLSNLDSIISKVPPKPKTKFVVSSKQEFPTIEGFPRAVTFLQINNVEMVRLDTRILRLQSLKVLNLEDNSLDFLPEQIDLLPCLKELHLAKNNFGKGTNWLWITGTSTRKNLTLLDLRHNQLMYFPIQLTKLKGLRTLLLDNNSLRTIPNGIGFLSKLQVLHLSNNILEWLPGSVNLLRLVSIDVSGNPEFNSANVIVHLKESGFPSLKDTAASCILRNKVRFSEEVLPRTLVDFLESSNSCFCKAPTFPSIPQCFIPFPIKRIAIEVTFSIYPIYISIRYCSLKCLRKHPEDGFPSQILPLRN